MPWAESVPVVVKTEHSHIPDNLHFPENWTFAVNASESVCPVESKPCKPLSHLLFAARVYLDVLIGISEVIGADDLPAKTESGDTRFSSFPATPAANHRKGKPHVVQPEAAGNGSPTEDYPKQPQPIGNRDGGTAARHHGKHGCQFCFFLPQ